MLIAQLTGSQMVLSYLKCPRGKTITSFIYTSKSKQYLAREFGSHFSCNSGQQSRKAQQCPIWAAQPTAYSDNIASDLTNILGVGNIWWNTESLEKISAGVSGHLHQPNTSQQQDGVAALPLHILRAFWMLPQRQAGSCISQAKCTPSPRDNQIQVFLEIEF